MSTRYVNRPNSTPPPPTPQGDASISDLRVSGLLGGQSISTIFSDAIPLNSSAHLTGRLTFLSPVHAASLHLTDGVLNDRDLIEFLSTVRLTTEDQVFRYPVHGGSVTLEAAKMRDLKVEGLLNGVNYTHVSQVRARVWGRGLGGGDERGRGGGTSSPCASKCGYGKPGVGKITSEKKYFLFDFESEKLM